VTVGAFILPTPGRAVRVNAGERSVLADVLAAGTDGIELAPREPLPGGPAALMYSTPRGVVLLTGELSVTERAVFVPREQQRAVQRRDAFRVPVHGPAELRRADGARTTISTLDVSATGALVVGCQGLEDGERVTLTFVIGGERLDLPAEVRRHEAADQVAVTFHEPPRAALAALERFIASEQRKLL
jgi:hypothetical protein